MATIDKRPLKAYVRFDGTGRIVPSSLILRRKKPKVGKWVEIPAYECCNPTTTTTTTAAPAFSYFANYSTASGPEACYQAQDQFSIYTAVTIGNGVEVFTDEALTTAASNGYYSVSGATYHVTSGVIDSVGSCPAATAFNYVINIADLANATGNTDTNLNGKVFALTADDGSGNSASRTFTAAGIYNHWMCSADPIVPTFGYYAADVFVTVGLISTQTSAGAC